MQGKKVVFITADELQGKDGGATGARRFVFCLSDFKKRGYIDDLIILSRDAFPNSLGIVLKKSRFLDVKARLFGESIFVSVELRKHLNVIRDYRPDIVIVSSRMGSIARYFQEFLPSCRVVVYFDNIEYDYCQIAMPKPFLFIEKRNVFKNEKDSVAYSSGLLFLSERDKKRCGELYPLSAKKPFCLFPCSIDSVYSLSVISPKPTLILLGNLSYSPNEDAVFWFVKEVFPKLFSYDIDVIVAGSNPGKKVADICQKNGIRLVGNFSSLSDFVPKGSCLIAPLFSGAGMKTKVAEALACGMFIIGTNEALVGYETLLKESSHCVLANSPQEFSEGIAQYRKEFFANSDFTDNLAFFKSHFLTSRIEADFQKFLFDSKHLENS